MENKALAVVDLAFATRVASDLILLRLKIEGRDELWTYSFSQTLASRLLAELSDAIRHLDQHNESLGRSRPS